jgi:hypothetical protein
MRAKNTSKQKQENFSKIISLRQIIFARILKKKTPKKQQQQQKPFSSELPVKSKFNNTRRKNISFLFLLLYLFYFTFL